MAPAMPQRSPQEDDRQRWTTESLVAGHWKLVATPRAGVAGDGFMELSPVATCPLLHYRGVFHFDRFSVSPKLKSDSAPQHSNSGAHGASSESESESEVWTCSLTRAW